MSNKANKIISGIKNDLKNLNPKKLLKKIDIKKTILKILPLALIFLISNKVISSWIYKKNSNIFSFPIIDFDKNIIKYSVIVSVIIKLLITTKSSNKKKYRHGKEYGSARWSA